MITPSRSLKSIYEINTPVYLNKLSSLQNQSITLASIPEEELARIASYGCDSVWLMGVWGRSTVAVEMAMHDEPLLNEVREVLPDFQQTDMIGSAYSIRSYQVSEAFGGEAALLSFRSRLAAHGLKLILDFVPNHSAFDHEWISLYPDYYIRGNVWSVMHHPTWYRKCGDKLIARGRDPHYKPWSDVAQLNAFSSSYRQASIDTLGYIATLCDGVRCDMAMLMTNDVFARTWGSRAGKAPATEYWREVISAVHQQAENFTFIAECYWDLQPALIEQGFDYCYDKDLYDFLVTGDIAGAQSRADAMSSIAPHLIHFLENHDEPRAATTFNLEDHRTAVQFIKSLPGACLWHDGQFEGYQAKLPVHIGRGPNEPTDTAIYDMYRGELHKD